VNYGFSGQKAGGHMARSMMLSELASVLADVPVNSEREGYRTAILERNVLGKPTFSSRQKSYRHLVELFALDPSLALFRGLRQFASHDKTSLPLLALTCVFCRDPQLRASFDLIQQLKLGEVLSRERMEEHLETAFPGRFSVVMKRSLAQHVNTTWTAAGHLVGRVVKKRASPSSNVTASTYAMFAGYLLGLRGEILLSSVFGSLVAADSSTLTAHLSVAARNGWVRFRHAGGVREIDFSGSLVPAEGGVPA
jgi:hypothetical protein